MRVERLSEVLQFKERQKTMDAVVDLVMVERFLKGLSDSLVGVAMPSRKARTDGQSSS
jgi:hypothetical protein